MLVSDVMSLRLRRRHPPEGLVEDLQDKVLLLGAADTQQVGSVPLTVEVGLQPAELLLLLGGVEHLHTGGKKGFIPVHHDTLVHN